jgi:NAD-dependent oxidoreductase involved in siderophore biosynthesis
MCGANVQVLEVATGELLVCDNLDLALALLGDGDGVSEVSGAALDLDAVVEELLEGLDIEDLVVHGLRAVDDELSLYY